MTKKLCLSFAVAAVAFDALSSPLTLPLWADGSPSRSIITRPIDETRLVRLAGNTRPGANARNDRGPADVPLDHMLLQLRRPADLKGQFERRIDSLTDKSSPNVALFRCWGAGQFDCRGHLTESRIPFSKPSIEPIIQHCAPHLR